MKNKPFVIILIIFVLAVIFIPLFIFSQNQESQKSVNTKLNVAVTIFPVYDIVKNIAGDKVNVNLILPVGESEHTFDPSPSDVARFENSQVVFKIGSGLDDWLEKVIDKKTLRVDLSSSVNLIESVEEPDAFDPHYWLSVDNALLIANKVKNELVKLDPENKGEYEINLGTYINELEDLQDYMNTELKEEDGKGIITFHEAFMYFAQDTGVKILATVEPFAGKEPTPLYLQELGEIIKTNQVRVLFKEPQLSSDILSNFVNDFGVEILTLDPLGGGNETNSYINMMKYNVSQINKGLSL